MSHVICNRRKLLLGCEGAFLTLLAFCRKMLYLCISRGAGRDGLPLFISISGLLSGKKYLFPMKKQVMEVINALLAF